MNTLERKAITLAHRQRHIESLQKLGYIKDTMHSIKRLEHDANRLQTADANGELSEVEASDGDMRISNRVATLFGGTLPKGFFINGDPRGYSLKLDPEAWRVSDDVQTNYEAQPINFTDWGGYLILAPEDF